MKAIIFQDFFHVNRIDKLLDLFKANSFYPNEIKSNLHKFHWPDIILTDEDNNNEPDYDIDILGLYYHGKEQIKLFVQKIEKTAINLNQQLKRDNKEIQKTIKELTTIVLLHEISHWIIIDLTISGSSAKFNFDVENKTREVDVLYFHEGLAQYFTWFSIKNRKSLREVYIELNKHQREEYKIYKQLLNSSDKVYNIAYIIKILKACREKNIQYWECFLKYITDYQSEKDIEKIIFKNRGCSVSKSFGF